MDCFNTSCAICFEIPDDDDLIIKTPCKHFICFKCFSEGGLNIRKCPLCRTHLMEAYICKRNEPDKIVYTLNEGQNHNCHCPKCVLEIIKNNTTY